MKCRCYKKTSGIYHRYDPISKYTSKFYGHFYLGDFNNYLFEIINKLTEFKKTLLNNVTLLKETKNLQGDKMNRVYSNKF